MSSRRGRYHENGDELELRGGEQEEREQVAHEGVAEDGGPVLEGPARTAVKAVSVDQHNAENTHIQNAGETETEGDGEGEEGDDEREEEEETENILDGK